MNNNYVDITLTIMGFECNPNEISAILGLEATKKFIKGELITHEGSIRHKSNGWSLKSKKVSSGYFEFIDSLNHIVSIIKPIKKKFLLLPPKSKIQLYCVVFSNREFRQQIDIDSDILKLLSEINANLVFEFY